MKIVLRLKLSKTNLFVSQWMITRSEAASSSCSVASDGGVRQPANRWPLSRKAMFPKRNDCRKLARALPTIGSHQIFIKVFSFGRKLIANSWENLHFVSLSGASCSSVVGGSPVRGSDRSSKLIINNEMSSTSERMGAVNVKN